MANTHLRNAPQLPLLTMGQCVLVFKDVGIPKAILARLAGFTRMQVFRWYTGQTAQPLRVTLEYVSELAYKFLRAQRAGKIPPLPCTKMRKWAEAVNDSSYPLPLNQMALHDIVSPEWACVLNLTLEAEDVPA